jgi:integrase
MPSLFKRSNGIYYFTYPVDGKTRWKSTGHTQKHMALQYLLQFNGSSPEIIARTTLSRFTSEFLASALANYALGTVKIYKQALTNFQSIAGDIAINVITPRHIDLYKTERLKNISPITLNIELRTLRAAFNTALKWRLIPENPFKRVLLLRIPEEQPTFLTQNDYQKLIATIPEKWFHDLVVIAVFTGIRRGEILNLTWKDLDFNKKLIYVQSKENFRTKCGKRRAVPMNETVFQVLSERLRITKTDLVYTYRGRKIADNLVTHKFKFYARKAGLNPKIHFHSCRHSFATWLVQNEVNIYEVQKLLGHTSVKMTEVYSHLSASELHGAVNKIDFLLS